MQANILQQGNDTWINCVLREGKNREIRKIMQFLGHPVLQLKRVGYAGFTLGNLQPGEIKEAGFARIQEIKKCLINSG